MILTLHKLKMWLSIRKQLCVEICKLQENCQLFYTEKKRMNEWLIADSDDLNTTWTKDVVEYKLTGPETASQQNWSSQQLELVDAKLNVA